MKNRKKKFLNTIKNSNHKKKNKGGIVVNYKSNAQERNDLIELFQQKSPIVPPDENSTLIQNIQMQGSDVYQAPIVSITSLGLSGKIVIQDTLEDGKDVWQDKI